MITREEFIKETVPGTRVVHKVSGYTGEVRVVFPEWGVEVWNPSRENERERWSWNMITKRFPRFIKRFPRPFRFPRLLPILQCHCKIGKLEVQGVKEVKCLRCGFLIGSEAFPNRYRRAEKLLRKWISDYVSSERDHQTPKRKRRPARQARKRVIRKAGTKRASNNRIRDGKKKKAPQKNPRNLVVRSRGRKEKNGKAKRKIQRKGNQKVSPNNPIPPPEGNDQREESTRTSQITGG